MEDIEISCSQLIIIKKRYREREMHGDKGRRQQYKRIKQEKEQQQYIKIKIATNNSYAIANYSSIFNHMNSLYESHYHYINTLIISTIKYRLIQRKISDINPGLEKIIPYYGTIEIILATPFNILYINFFK